MAPKKTKGEKMDLGTFLTDSTLGSWADEMEDAPMPYVQPVRIFATFEKVSWEAWWRLILAAPSGRGAYGGDRPYNSGGAFGSSAADRGGYSVREQLPLPTKPPYTVHLGNMSFDATEGDITDFFSGCQVTSVRIVEDKLERKPKGFGYAEFATLDGLKKALDANNTQFQGRNIRVSVAEPQKDRPDVREFSDWTRKGPLPDIPGQRRVSERGGFGSGRGGFDNASDAGSERAGRRSGYEQGDGKIRDFGNWDRKGPLIPSLPTGPAARSFDRPASRDGPPNRRNSPAPAWGEGRSQDGSRPPRREFVERPPVERVPTAAEQDNQWRAKMRPDAPPAPPVQPAQAPKSPAIPTRELSTPPSPAGAPAAPATRPRLNLAKRTVSEAPPEANSSDAAPAADSKASPFGAAKPIDTATREKEVEEKRQIAKKEAEEKARAEKKAAEDKAREDKKVAREAEQANKTEQANKAEQTPTPAWKQRPPQEKVNGQEQKKANGQEQKKANGQAQEKDNGASVPPPGRSYEILRRTANEDSSAADEETEEAEAAEETGLVSEDKAVKPKEIVRDIGDGGAQTNGSPAAGTPELSADALEGDGWSTVSKPEKKRKNGNQAARAMAS